MSDERESILRKIQGLLSKTLENNASEAEVASAIAAATRLMDTYNIAMSEVYKQDGQDIHFEETVIHSAKSVDGHWLTSMQIASGAFSVKGLMRRHKSGGYTTQVSFCLFGDKANVENAAWAMNFLARVLKRLWKEFRTENPESASWANMNAFYAGVSAGFTKRMRDERAAAEQEQPGTSGALVLIDTKLAEAFAKTVGRTVGIKRRAAGSEAFAGGFAQGQKLTLNRPLGGDKGTRSISK